jgi:predicted phosphoadenosine phosphosulfate sulfurtransferase
MLRLRRTSMIVALSLLTSAATASAEGAWVLWEHSYEVWVDSNK